MYVRARLQDEAAFNAKEDAKHAEEAAAARQLAALRGADESALADRDAALARSKATQKTRLQAGGRALFYFSSFISPTPALVRVAP